MDISLTAKLKKYNDFIDCYKEGDEKELYKGKSLLFYSLSNNDVESRFLISDFLLEKETDATIINEDGENLLHILLSRTKHDIHQTESMCRKLIEKGVDINQLDNKGRVPLQYIINLKNTDEELEPLYQIWLAQDRLLVNHKNAWGKSPIELAEMMPYRASFLERIRKYE